MRSIAGVARSRDFLVASVTGIILLALAYLVAHGTLRNFALGSAVALAVPLIYFAIEKPLLFPFGLYAALVPFEDILSIGHSATINKILGILACIAILFSILRRGHLVKPSPGVIAWLAMAMLLGVSGFWTIDPQNWQAAYITFASNFLLYAFLSMAVATVSDLKMLGTCVVIGGLLAAATALWPFMHGVSAGGRLVLPGSDPLHHPDPNRFAAALLLPLGVLFAATLGTRRPLPFIANVGGLALLIVTIVLTGSRSAMIAILVLLGYIVIRSRRVHGIYALLVLGSIAAFPFATTMQRWSIAVSSGGAGRTDIWQVAWQSFKDHWFAGSGYGSFEAAYDQYVLKTPLQAYIGWHRAPHDMVISMAVQLGIVGLALVVVAFIFVFRDLRIPTIRGYLGDLKLALEGILLGLLVDSLFLDIIETKFLWLLFIMIALLRSTIISTVASTMRRRTTCAALSSPTPDPVSAPEISRV